MVTSEDLLALHYYDYGQAFTGSLSGMGYRLEKVEDKEQPCFLATVWQGPYALFHTPPEKRRTKTFPFSEEGRAEAACWFNTEYDEHREFYDQAPGILDVVPWKEKTGNDNGRAEGGQA